MKYFNLFIFSVSTFSMLAFMVLFDWVLDSSAHYEAFLARDLVADQVASLINNQEKRK